LNNNAPIILAKKLSKDLSVLVIKSYRYSVCLLYIDFKIQIDKNNYINVYLSEKVSNDAIDNSSCTAEDLSLARILHSNIRNIRLDDARYKFRRAMLEISNSTFHF